MSDMQIVDQKLNKDNDVQKLSDNLQAETENNLKSLIEENLEMTREIRVMVKHINRYVAWQRIFGVLKIFIILIPLIIGAIYLPPILIDSYKQILSILQSNVN